MARDTAYEPVRDGQSLVGRHICRGSAHPSFEIKCEIDGRVWAYNEEETDLEKAHRVVSFDSSFRFLTDAELERKLECRRRRTEGTA